MSARGGSHTTAAVKHRWEITPAELARLRRALDRLADRGDHGAALGALAHWALALVDAGAILVALRGDDERLRVEASAGRGTARLLAMPLDELARGDYAGDVSLHAWLRVPIVLRGVEVGIVVARPARGRKLEERDALLLRLLAVQAAIAVAQRRADVQIVALYEQERRRAEQLAAAAEIGRTLVRIHRLGDALDFAASALKSLFGYGAVAIYLRDADQSRFVLHAAAGGEAPGATLDLDEPRAAAWAARSGEPQLVADRRRLSPRLDAVNGASAASAPLSELAVPIGIGRRSFGVLALASDAPDAFDGSDLALAQAVAGEVAITVENARLATKAREDAAAAERSRLARELHDDTAQQLVAIGRRLDLMGMGAAETPIAAQIEEVHDLVDQALQNVRRISRDLRPAVLEDLGLVAALEAIAADASRSGGPQVKLDVSGAVRSLPPRVELALYRIAQEAFANALRHAAAARIGLRLAFHADAVEIDIADDGRGFRRPADLTELERGGGLGVVGMRERMAEVGGRLELTAAPGEGTRVRARVPAV